jgi:outer membrane protein OmpA-like peptidoglycan-associated protein
LVSKGINSRRLSYKGLGNSKPLVEEDSDKDKELNRRVEIKLRK